MTVDPSSRILQPDTYVVLRPNSAPCPLNVQSYRGGSTKFFAIALPLIALIESAGGALVQHSSSTVAGQEGSAPVAKRIATDGSLAALRVLSTERPEFAQVAAVSKWEFEPTVLNGKPLEIVTVDFKNQQ